MHVKSNRGQDIDDFPLIQAALAQPQLNRLAGERAGQVPGLGQRFDAQAVKLNPAAGQARALIVNQGQQGQQERRSRQAFDGGRDEDGLGQAFGAGLGAALGLGGQVGRDGISPYIQCFVSAAPLAGKGFDPAALEGADGERRESWAEGGG